MAISMQPDLESVGVATRVADALEALREEAPDVVLMDVGLPGVDGIEGTRRVKDLLPKARVLVLTAHTTPEVMAQAAAAGAAGFLPKESPMADILRAIRTANDGGMTIEHSTLLAVLEEARRRSEPRPAKPALTRRERDVLELMGSGLDAATIAKQLGITLNTCRGYVKAIFAKLGAHSQLEAVVAAVRAGLIAGPRS